MAEGLWEARPARPGPKGREGWWQVIYSVYWWEACRLKSTSASATGNPVWKSSGLGFRKFKSWLRHFLCWMAFGELIKPLDPWFPKYHSSKSEEWDSLCSELTWENTQEALHCTNSCLSSPNSAAHCPYSSSLGLPTHLTLALSANTYPPVPYISHSHFHGQLCE